MPKYGKFQQQAEGQSREQREQERGPKAASDGIECDRQICPEHILNEEQRAAHHRTWAAAGCVPRRRGAAAARSCSISARSLWYWVIAWSRPVKYCFGQACPCTP